MNLDSRKVMSTGRLSKRNKSYFIHRMPVHLHPEIKVTILASIHRTSEPYLHNLNLSCHKEVVGLLHVKGIVEPTEGIVVRARKVASNVEERVIS